VLFPPGSPAAFPSPRFKASGFASHPFRWFAFSSFKDCSTADFAIALYRAKQMPTLIVKVEMRFSRSKDDFGKIKMPLNLKELGGKLF
jgi:hypothetical protein